MAVKPVVCKFCGMGGHYQTWCLMKPKPRIKTKKWLSKQGKLSREWILVRAAWFDAHPADFYTCYICGDTLPKKLTTLDHVIPKSNAANYANRHDFNNLKPCCWRCNTEKGSRHGQN